MLQSLLVLADVSRCFGPDICVRAFFHLLSDLFIDVFFEIGKSSPLVTDGLSCFIECDWLLTWFRVFLDVVLAMFIVIYLPSSKLFCLLLWLGSLCIVLNLYRSSRVV